MFVVHFFGAGPGYLAPASYDDYVDEQSEDDQSDYEKEHSVSYGTEYLQQKLQES